MKLRSKMTQNNVVNSHLWTLPTEVLLCIFTFLSAKQLIKCRQVCVRWMEVIDGMTRCNAFWREHCERDFQNVYSIARKKARPGLLWYNIYKSLTLWPKLMSARETRDEFASASVVNDEVRSFEILRNGEIGVHTRTAIVYYDIETLERNKRSPITGDYLTYTENDDTLVILGYHLHLFVIRKIICKPTVEPDTTFENVKMFILCDKEIFYVTLQDEIYVCDLNDDCLQSTFINRCEDSVVCIGYANKHLQILTFQRNIYTVVDKNLVFVDNLGADSNLLHVLRKYNFLEHLDWRVYFQWMYILNHSIPEGPLRDIIIIKTYGEVVFVGSNWGVLRIYYAPYSNEEFNIFNAEPVKQYNFMERCDCPVLSTCPILQIDISESEDGHSVFVAMPKKIAVLNFVHNFKRTASVAMLPYSDVQSVKIFKVDSCI